MRCFIVCSCIGEVFIDSLELLLRDQVEILRDDAFRKSCNLRDFVNISGSGANDFDGLIISNVSELPP